MPDQYQALRELPFPSVTQQRSAADTLQNVKGRFAVVQPMPRAPAEEQQGPLQVFRLRSHVPEKERSQGLHRYQARRHGPGHQCTCRVLPGCYPGRFRPVHLDLWRKNFLGKLEPAIRIERTTC